MKLPVFVYVGVPPVALTIISPNPPLQLIAVVMVELATSCAGSLMVRVDELTQLFSSVTLTV